MKSINLPDDTPMLPGHKYTDPYKVNYHKSQLFGVKSGAQVESTAPVKEEIDPDLIKSLYEGPPKAKTGMAATRDKAMNEGVPINPPHWLKYDRQVLRFYGYYQEPVVESRVENFRVRKMVIHHHLDDGTTHITERKIENSGLPQGVFIKRSKIPLPDEDGHYTYEHFNVGKTLEFYRRRFRIIDADDYTKAFYNQHGISLGQPEDYPTDKFGENRVMLQYKQDPEDKPEIKEYIEVKLGGGHPNKGLEQYLNNDRQVLQFDVEWNDTAYNGGKKYYKLNYFLSNDTLEVKEVRYSNSGIDPYPLLLRRSALPKKQILTYCPGMIAKPQEYYKEQDLICGQTINILGRECIIYNCDDFTKKWYQIKLGINQQPLPLAKKKCDLIHTKQTDYLGFGGEEDSLRSVHHLAPLAPIKRVEKAFKSGDHILRFEAKLVGEEPGYDTRKFVISFYCGDDTIQIYEIADKNSGIIGGKFMERKPHKHPVKGDFYSENDMLIGSLLLVGGFKFRLIAADEYTWKYYEQNPEVFKQSSMYQIFKKIACQKMPTETLGDFCERLMFDFDTNKDQYLSFEEFFNGLERMNIFMTEHERNALFRKFDTNKDRRISLQEFFNSMSQILTQVEVTEY